MLRWATAPKVCSVNRYIIGITMSIPSAARTYSPNCFVGLGVRAIVQATLGVMKIDFFLSLK